VTVRVVNPLGVPVDVGGITLRGGEGSSFQMGEDLCSGVRVPAGKSCTVSVAFSPLTEGPAAAEVAIVSSAGDSRLTLTGEGGQGVDPARRRGRGW
jgi:hypothetical protein